MADRTHYTSIPNTDLFNSPALSPLSLYRLATVAWNRRMRGHEHHPRLTWSKKIAPRSARPTCDPAQRCCSCPGTSDKAAFRKPNFARANANRQLAIFSRYHFSWSFSPPSPTPPRNKGLKSPPSLGRTEKKSNRPFWTPNFCPSTSKPEETAELLNGNKDS